MTYQPSSLSGLIRPIAEQLQLNEEHSAFVGASQKRITMLGERMADSRTFEWERERFFGQDVDGYRNMLETELMDRLRTPILLKDFPHQKELEPFKWLHMHMSPYTHPDMAEDSWILQTKELTMISSLQQRDGYFMLNIRPLGKERSLQ